MPRRKKTLDQRIEEFKLIEARKREREGKKRKWTYSKTRVAIYGRMVRDKQKMEFDSLYEPIKTLNEQEKKALFYTISDRSKHLEMLKRRQKLREENYIHWKQESLQIDK